MSGFDLERYFFLAFGGKTLNEDKDTQADARTPACSVSHEKPAQDALRVRGGAGVLSEADVYRSAIGPHGMKPNFVRQQVADLGIAPSSLGYEPRMVTRPPDRFIQCTRPNTFVNGSR